MAELEAEAVALLGRLVRHRTVNPPGGERPLQEELARLLADAGFDVALVGRTSERPNLVARLRGAAPGPTLGLLSHVDTVLADPADWARDPWGGEVVDGRLWGRGALDMKSQTAAEAAAAASLGRSGWRPARGDLLVIAVVDEETGGADGARWLCEQRPELARCDWLVNEGAGALIPYEGRRLHGVCVAEKGVFRFRLTTSGAAGHASSPRTADNALVKLAPLLASLGNGVVASDLTEPAVALLRELGVPAERDPDGAVAALRERDPVLATFVEPMLGVTFAPTMAEASQKINVVPARATLGVDCRVPPGAGEALVRSRLAELLGQDGYEIEFTERVVGNASPPDTPLMDAIRGWMAREDPGASIVPVMLPAFTDSRTFREAFPDCVAYGFFPMLHSTLYETWPLVHGADERVDVRDVGVAARCYRDLALELLG